MWHVTHSLSLFICPRPERGTFCFHKTYSPFLLFPSLFSVKATVSLWVYENKPNRSGEYVGCPVQDLFVHSQTVRGKSGVETSPFNPIQYLLYHKPTKNINNYILSFFREYKANPTISIKLWMQIYWVCTKLFHVCCGVLSKLVNIYCLVIPSY